MIILTDLSFPDPNLADKHGLLAAGGDLSPDRLVKAYHSGVFPWYSAEQPILWWSPDPRMVLFPENLHVSKSMQRLFRKKPFQITYNKCFDQVIKNCAEVPRSGQDGTWITPEMIKAYNKLHELGFAHSVEVWQKENLVAGLYGVFLQEKQIFCGESMFTKTGNASKFGFIALVHKLKSKGVKLIDCQVYSNHLESLGAEEIPRRRFLKYLNT